MEKHHRLILLTGSVLSGLMANTNYNHLTVEEISRLAVEQAEDADAHITDLLSNDEEYSERVANA